MKTGQTENRCEPSTSKAAEQNRKRDFPAVGGNGRNPKASGSEKDEKGRAGTMKPAILVQYTALSFDTLEAALRRAHGMNLEWSGCSRPSGKGFGFLCDKRIESDSLFGVMLALGEIQMLALCEIQEDAK